MRRGGSIGATATTDEDEATAAIKAWATGMSARTLWRDQAKPWVLRTKRRRRSLRRTQVVFPHPGTLTDPEAAERWEVRARVAAAEHVSSGNFGNWFATLVAGVVFGGVWSSVISVLTPATSWVAFVVAVIVSGVAFGVLTGLLLVTVGRTLLVLYERAPMWQARADAYARRRAELLAAHACGGGGPAPDDILVLSPMRAALNAWRRALRGRTTD